MSKKNKQPEPNVAEDLGMIVIILTVVFLFIITSLGGVAVGLELFDWIRGDEVAHYHYYGGRY